MLSLHTRYEKASEVSSNITQLEAGPNEKRKNSEIIPSIHCSRLIRSPAASECVLEIQCCVALHVTTFPFLQHLVLLGHPPLQHQNNKPHPNKCNGLET